MELKENDLEYTNNILLIDRCPFCNGIGTLDNYEMVPFESIHLKKVGGNGKWHFIICTECNACGPQSLTDEEAIEKWNRRAVNG